MEIRREDFKKDRGRPTGNLDAPKQQPSACDGSSLEARLSFELDHAR
jgi:hypothetical protein